MASLWASVEKGAPALRPPAALHLTHSLTVNSELFTLTYGSLVRQARTALLSPHPCTSRFAQLLNDSEDCVDDVNVQLDKLCAPLWPLPLRWPAEARPPALAAATTSARAWWTSTSPRRAAAAASTSARRRRRWPRAASSSSWASTQPARTGPRTASPAPSC